VVSWSIIEQLHLDPSHPSYRGDRIDVIQPTLVALALAYAAWLRSIGITPDAVVGHSLGEVGAAVIAGAIDLPTAMRIICVRSALLQRTSGRGAMAVIDLPADEVERRIATGSAGVTVSVLNSPRSTVVSGTPDGIDALLGHLERDGVYARRVSVDVASHGPQMDALVPELVNALADVVPSDGDVALYSSVTAARADGSTLTAAYWGRNLRHPVQFAATVEQMLADGYTAFVELGPHAVLSYAVQHSAQQRRPSAARHTTTRRATDVTAMRWCRPSPLLARSGRRVLPSTGTP
jgi:acyl transferase domain-containing protein